MKKHSTIGRILQFWAVVNVIGGAVLVTVMLGIGKGAPESLVAAIGIGLVVTSVVVVLLGAAELLHAVMRTAAATEETVELLRAQVGGSVGAAARMNRMAALPALRGVGAGVAVGSQSEDGSEFESKVWMPAEETKCEVCHNFFTLPARNTAQVVCPHCGVSGAWPG